MSRLFIFIIAVCTCLSFVHAKPGKIAILGDSITYDGKWPALVEAAIRQSPGMKDAEIVNFGLPSETASGLSEDGHAGGAFPRPCIHDRLSRILSSFKPDLVIACYGINDGIYQPLDNARFDAYKKGITRLKTAVDQSGAKTVFITPPLYQPDRDTQDDYDKVMDSYGAWLMEQRGKGWMVIDMRPGLKQAVDKAKQEKPTFRYASDGVHPGPEGHRMIAEALWPGLAELLKFKPDATFPGGEEFDNILRRATQTKTDWLIKTGHARPHIPGYIPVTTVKLPEGHTLSAWNEFARHDFKIDGRNAFIVFPKKPAKGNPWIWRTEFFGHEPQADIALIDKGFAAAYVDVQNMYGSPKAMEIMDKFHQYATRTYSLSQKTVLEGFSRGGLFALNWAALNPAKVAALYIDNPVCDFKSWPGGKGTGPGSPNDWKLLQEAYGFANEEEALAYRKNPVDNLAPLAKARIPVIAVIKVDDTLVPVKENIDIVEQRYKAMKGPIQVIRGPGGHHPHSLKDASPIVDFILTATGQKKEDASR